MPPIENPRFIKTSISRGLALLIGILQLAQHGLGQTPSEIQPFRDNQVMLENTDPRAPFQPKNFPKTEIAQANSEHSWLPRQSPEPKGHRNLIGIAAATTIISPPSRLLCSPILHFERRIPRNQGLGLALEWIRRPSEQAYYLPQGQPTLHGDYAAQAWGGGPYVKFHFIRRHPAPYLGPYFRMDAQFWGGAVRFSSDDPADRAAQLNQRLLVSHYIYPAVAMAIGYSRTFAEHLVIDVSLRLKYLYRLALPDYTASFATLQANRTFRNLRASDTFKLTIGIGYLR